MAALKIVFVLYGILMLFGGYMGYVKAGSTVSLITGVISGVLVLLGVFLSGSNPAVGCQIVAAVSGILTLVFLVRLIKTHSLMPSGMLLLASLIIFILSFKQFVQK